MSVSVSVSVALVASLHADSGRVRRQREQDFVSGGGVGKFGEELLVGGEDVGEVLFGEVAVEPGSLFLDTGGRCPLRPADRCDRGVFGDEAVQDSGPLRELVILRVRLL